MKRFWLALVWLLASLWLSPRLSIFDFRYSILSFSSPLLFSSLVLSLVHGQRQRQSRAEQGKARQGKARQGKAKQVKARKMLIQYLRSMPVQEAVRRTVPVIAGTAISFAFFQQKFQSNMPGTLSSEWRSKSPGPFFA